MISTAIIPLAAQYNPLIQGINLFYDFVNMPEADAATITTITDQRGAFNGTGVNSPTCEVITFDSQTIKTYKDETNKAFTLSDPAVSLFSHSLECWAVISSTDGIQTSGIQICGARTADTNVQFSVFIGASGATQPGSITAIWGYTGARVNWRTTDGVIADGSLPITLIRVRINFEGDTIRFYINEEEKGSTVVDGTLSALDPALYDNTANMHVGTINANGTLSSNTSASNFYKFLLTNRLRGVAEAANYQQEALVASALIGDILKHYTNWQNELDVTNANIATKRAAMITYLFNGGGLPTADTPATTDSSYTGLMHGVNTTSLVGAGTVVQIRWNLTDGDTSNWSYFQYLIPNSTPTTDWIIVHRGHGSEGAAASLTIINRALSEGYNVFWMAMPVASPDTDGQNTTNNPAATAGHEALYEDGIDTVSYNALELFLGSQVRGINYLEANYTVTALHAIGLSGGAWSVSMLASVDTRIEKTVAVRGFMPRSAKYYPFYTAGFEPDFEQGGANGLSARCGPRVEQFFTDHPALEIMAMCTDGGRMYGSITHTNDTARFGGYTWLAWKPAMKSKAVELGGRYFQYLNRTTGESAHLYQASELTRAFYELAL